VLPASKGLSLPLGVVLNCYFLADHSTADGSLAVDVLLLLPLCEPGLVWEACALLESSSRGCEENCRGDGEEDGLEVSSDT